MDPETFPEKDPHTYAIIGAAMEVHRELGPGFLEPVYQEALSLELTSRNIPHLKEVTLEIAYKQATLKTTYRADFICHNSIILELKALDRLSSSHTAQVINYLKATNFPKALLLNFGASSLEHKRLIHTPKI
ncbi:MAG: GxxExxY protein [Verrucomicrobiota bacterium]